MGLIRLFLALVVAGDHFTVLTLLRPGITKDGIQQWIYMNAGFAVMFFYVISGFLISYALSNKYHYSTAGTIDFFKSRAVRIFSLYWPLFLICLFFWGGKGEWSLRDIFVNVFLIGGDWLLAFQAYPIEKTPFLPSLGQVWSVSAELTFYLLAPFVLRSLPATVSLVVFSLATRIALEQVFDFHQAWNYHFFPSAIWFFLVGHLSREIHERGLIRVRGSSWILLVASMALLTGTRHGGFVSVWFYASVICFALSLPGIFHATKDSKVLNFLGDLSYPIYLIHMMVLWHFVPSGTFGFLDSLARSGTPLPLIVILFMVIVFVIGVLTHFLIERPCVSGFNKLLRLGRRRHAFAI
jgi:peptidoglycan/LPS O-acetylase OafA/YrhL